MKNKALLIAGLGLGSALTLSIFGLSSANETTAVDAATSTKAAMSVPAHSMMKRDGMKGGMMNATMMKGEKGMFMMKFGGPEGENSAMHSAVEANDYNAFVTARNAETNKPEDAAVPTQEQFTQMVTMQQKHSAIETAIENNDYDGYVKATTPTRDEFNQMVAMRTTQKAVQTAIEAKDYTAFQTAVKDTPMADMTEEQFTKMSERPAKMKMVEKATRSQ